VRLVECNYENCSDDAHHPHCKEMRWKRYAWRIKERTALRIVICLFIVFILMIALGILLLILAVK
jgi:hypothetical protein